MNGEIELMFIESFNKILKVYYRKRFSINPNERRKRGKSAALLKEAFQKFEAEFNSNPVFDGLSIDLSDGSGNLSTKPFFRIYHPQVSSSGKKGFYIAISFFTEPGNEKLMISITKGREDSDSKPEEDRAITQAELREASLQFEHTHFSGRAVPKGIILISDNENKDTVAVASKTISAKSLATKKDNYLIKALTYLCEVYREYVDQCFISEDLPAPLVGSKKALVNIRQGHLKFRKEVSKRCKNKCVLTGCDLLDACDAAHILPYSEWAGYSPDNGLLMRADIHKLFDRNKIIIEANGEIQIIDQEIKNYYSGIIPKRIRSLSNETKAFLHRRNILIP